MRVSLNELGRWIDASVLRDPQDLAHRLTMVGLEVEDVRRVGEGQERIVVGRIAAIEEHPSADRLVVCRVDTGSGELHQVVCGATNMKEGDLVPVALPGSKPPALDFEIGSRKVAGVQSEGMLCAEEELGLAAKSDGLWILEGDLELGKPVFEATGRKDVQLEISLTPNRPDCLSHLGVAREVAAIYGVKLDESALDASPAWEAGEGAVDEVASLEVVDSEGCPRYVAAVLENVKVGPSPAWLRRMVVAMGMRSINNVVDVTNVVLADIGQPLHAFDLDKLEGNAIVVRRAQPGEKIEAIDHKTYELDPTDLVIADARRPVAIAGVMGGADSEVTDETTRILLECAYFQPTTVRKTSKRLGIHSESSHRFERGIDPAATVRNAAYAMAMLLRTQKDYGHTARVRAGILEHNVVNAEPVRLSVSESLVPRILGVKIPPAETVKLLAGIGIAAAETAGGIEVTVPTFRPDIERPIDVVEEIARLWGYDRFEPRLPAAPMGASHAEKSDREHDYTIVPRRKLRLVEQTRVRLLAAGLHEAVNYSFISRADLDLLGLAADDPRRAAPKLSNPLSVETELMRTTLVPGLLRSLATNVAQRNADVGLFETGRRFGPEGDANMELALLLTGAARRHFSGSRAWDFYDAKGLVESLIGEHGDRSVWGRPTRPHPYLHPGVQAEWTVDGIRLGLIGQIHPAVLAALDVDLEAPVFVAELDLDAITAVEAVDRKFAAFPRYPAVTRDFALLYDRDADWSAIDAAVRGLATTEPAFGDLLESVDLFDLYQGEQVPADKRSLAIQVVYRSSERTLTEDEVARADQALLAHLFEVTGATLR